MLKEISCDAFKIGDQPRPPVRFHMGLNTILGSVTGAAGSIGKSTMMLIIDFVFGGNTYTQSDAVNELDPHTIYFSFEFDNTEYRFSRNTEEADVIVVVDENRNALESWDIKKYTQWLAQQYNMNLPGASFRNTISRFFRIYGKNNHNELKPLQTRGGEEPKRDAINVLISLFQYYESIEDFKKQLQYADERIKAFRTARRYEFIPSAVDGLTKYKANVVEIASLELERRKLANLDEADVQPAEVEKANERNVLKRSLDDTRREIKARQDELHLLNLNLQHGAYPTEADLQALHEFFPEADLEALVKVEKFHSRIQTILSEELRQAKTAVEADISELQEVEAKLLSHMDSIPASKAFTDEFLDAYTSLDRRINKLKDENEAFDIRNRLGIEKKDASEHYHNQVATVLEDIEISINTQMEAINDEVTGGEYNAPKLTLSAYNSYTFETPKDKGTGTNHRSMIIYDLAVLQNTVLPALAHDSVMFDSMPRPDFSNLIRVYNDQIEKQIFIAVDKTSECTQEAQHILRETTVLKLDNNEQALFGEKWSRKERT